MGATVAKRKGWSFPSAGASSSGTRGGLGDATAGTDGKGKHFFQKHSVYLVFCALVMAWALSTRLRQFVLDRESAEPNKVLSIKTRCQELRGGLGPDDVGGCTKKVTRLLHYCHEEVGKVDGDEGIANVKNTGEDFELVHLLLTVRHGDRSAIHSMPHALGTEEAEAKGARPLEPWQYSKDGLNHPVHGNEFLDLRALSYVPSLKKFDLRAVENGDISDLYNTNSESKQEQSDSEKLEHQELPPVRPLPPALEASSVFQTPDFDLAPGQLTTRGFMQEFNLGSYMKGAYEAFLESRVIHPVHAYVRTTNYPRTIQSVAGLMLGMLPDVGGPDHPITLWSHLSETSEVMHGIGLRLSSRGITANNPGDKEIVGGCPRSVGLAKKQKQSYVMNGNVHSRIDSLFGNKASSRFVTDLADASLPPLCHNRPLPCSLEENKGCMTEPDLGELMEEADRAFCARYTGEDGGGVATKLSIYPFLQEILGALREAAHLDSRWSALDAEVEKKKKEAESKGIEYIPSETDNILPQEIPDPLTPGGTVEIDLRREERRSLYVFMGHDTVIAPVLAGLGLYKGSLCAWPPYASRISFELLKPTRGGKAAADTKYYVRIIYNGKDLTPQVEKCAGVSPCPLDMIEKTVADLLAPHPSLEAACKE